MGSGGAGNHCRVGCGGRDFGGPGWRGRRCSSAADRGKNPGGGRAYPRGARLGRLAGEMIKAPEKREFVPPVPEESDELVKLVSQERVQKYTAEVPVHLVELVPQEQV